MATLTATDLAIIDGLARHYRCPLSEVAEMKLLAAEDAEVMESYRRMAAESLLKQSTADRRQSPAYLAAMADLERIGLKRRRKTESQIEGAQHA